MRIKWTAEAETHLDGIYHYIAKDAPLYARRTLDKLTRRTDHLIEQRGQSPLQGPGPQLGRPPE